jgi:outer membrane protein assembly factor BamE
MGEPILGNTFQADRWEYIYNIQVGSQERRQQRLTLHFDGDALNRFEGDFVPSELQVVQDAALQEAVDNISDS